MATEVYRWKKMFGEEVAQQLQVIAENEMPDYEYLRQFKA